MTHRNLPRFSDDSYAHFITTRTYANRPYFEKEEFACIVVEELGFYKQKLGFVQVGYVIMPDHLHLLLWWDKDERPGLSVSRVMQGVKGTAARRIVDLAKARGLERMLQSTRKVPGHKSRERDGHADQGSRWIGSHKRDLRHHLWQPGFYDFNVRTEEKLMEKLRYIHDNPFRAGLAKSPGDYRWSSWREYFDGEMPTPALGIEGEMCPR